MADLALLLHMHQPDYRHPATGRPIMPWARLHALRGYRDVALDVLEADVDVTINLVPSLLDQLLDYAVGGTDRHLDLTARPADDLRPEEVEEIRRTFVAGHPAMVEAHEAYRVLRRRNEAGDRLAVRSVRDLQVWSTLAWFGSTALRDHPILAELQAKGAGFSEADKRAMLAVQQRVIQEIPSIYARLAASCPGRISLSPYYHPILPLLVDATHARRCMPDLPDEVAFRWPQDALLQLSRARQRAQEVLGIKPRGLWPSEGSVSPEVVRLASEAGFRWLVTDEEVLHRSDKDGRPSCGPWDLGSGVVGFFRDHGLSDRIGFQYARWDARDAVADLLGAAAARPGLLVLALDGENPWESFQDAGAAFRQGLFRALRTGPVRAVTLDQAADQAPVGRVRRLHTGSWIGADFKIWIGHPDDRRAWQLLAHAREAIEAESDPIRRARAMDRLLPAEGSDWMWWYGDEFTTSFAPVFDHLFREHLRGVYRELGVPAPEHLDQAIGQQQVLVSRVRPPLQELRPRLEAEPRWIHWAGAGWMGWPAQGSMARAGRDVPRVYFGWSSEADGAALWLRIALSAGRGGEEPGAVWRIDLGHSSLELPCDQPGAVAEDTGLMGVIGPRDIVLRAEAEALPPGRVGLSLAVVSGEGTLARWPEYGEVALPQPEQEYPLEWWSV